MAKKKEEPALNKAAVDKITSLLTSMDKHLYGMVLRLSTIAENISSIQTDDKLKGASGKDEEKEKEKTGFAKVLQKLDDITGKFEKFTKSVLSGAKPLLGFGALALLFFDPQALFSILSKTVLFVADMVDAINKFMNGDIKEGFSILYDNLGGVAISLGAIALLFGGRILSVVRSIITTAEFLYKGILLFSSGMSKVYKGVVNIYNFFKNFEQSMEVVGKSVGRFIGKIQSVASFIGKFLEPVIKVIQSGISMFSKAMGFAGDAVGFLGKAAPAIGKGLLSLIGKLAFPITVIMGIVGAVQGAIEGFQQDGIIGGIKGAIVGLFDGVIGGLLDMVKGAVSWIAGMFGFDNVSAALDSFSFTGLFSNLIDAVFYPIEVAIDWVKTLFSDPIGALQQLWDGLGIGGIVDYVFGFVSGAWDWVSSIFTLPDFSALMGDRSIGQVFDDAWNGIIDWFTGVFDFLPSMEEIKSTLMSLLPSWLQPASVEELASELETEGGVTREEVLAAKSQAELEALATRADNNSYTYGYNEAMAAMEAMRVSLPQMRNGGILNADPRGSLTMLHGTEAVIPLDSANARSMLENIKTSPMDQRRANYALNNMADMAGRKEKASITSLSAPTVVHNGGSNVTNITNISNAGTSRYLRPQYELG